MRKTAILLGTLALAAGLLPSVAAAARSDVAAQHIVAKPMTDQNGKPDAVTSFSPVIAVPEAERSHVTLRWLTKMSCGTTSPTDLLVPGDDRTPLTILWSYGDCGTVKPTAEINLGILYDGAPILSCQYSGGPDKGVGDPCYPVPVGAPVALFPAKPPAGPAAAPAAAVSAPRTPEKRGSSSVPLAVGAGPTLLIIALVIWRVIAKKKKK